MNQIVQDALKFGVVVFKETPVYIENELLISWNNKLKENTIFYPEEVFKVSDVSFKVKKGNLYRTEYEVTTILNVKDYKKKFIINNGGVY